MRYKLFGEHTGLRVSEFILGTGNFGTAWGYGAEADESRRILDRYLEVGGNFIDTADAYQNGQAEEIIGEAIVGRRHEVAVGTKYTMPVPTKAGILTTGNSRKAMIVSVEHSLKRLRTDYIDMLWIHMADGATPAEEIVRGFDDLVRAGKILYAGLSNFPAWRAVRAATIAELRGTVPIAGLQFEHSLVDRTNEAEIVAAGTALGMGLVAWSPMGGGMLTGKYRNGETGRREGFGGAVFQAENTPQRTAILDTVSAIAKDIGAQPGEVALAWVAAKGEFPIIGPRTVAQLESNLAALNVKLSPDHLSRLDEVSGLLPASLYATLEGARAGYTGGDPASFDAPARIVA
jgi:aryl-alcohol dehydrogenase-like predicted oxidoreductase